MTAIAHFVAITCYIGAAALAATPFARPVGAPVRGVVALLAAGVLVGTNRPGSLYLEGGLLIAVVLFGWLLAVLTIAGCQEKLTAPADCPALCPGGQAQVFDEVLTAIDGADSSFVGYVQPHQAAALLVSNGLEGFEEHGLVRFLARPGTITVRDTARTYTIDSVALKPGSATRMRGTATATRAKPCA